MCLKFAKSGLKNETLLDLVKPNTNKEDPMATRNVKTHKIEPSNMSRYGRSSIPYMGQMLEDGKNIQSLASNLLDVFLYNF